MPHTGDQYRYDYSIVFDQSQYPFLYHGAYNYVTCMARKKGIY